MTLTAQQRNTLYILGYLFLRMGRFTQAEKVFSALAALEPQDLWVQRNLGVIALERRDGAKALKHLDKVFESSDISSENIVLLFARAKALWLEGHQEEARKVCDEYLQLSGGAL